MKKWLHFERRLCQRESILKMDILKGSHLYVFLLTKMMPPIETGKLPFFKNIGNRISLSSKFNRFWTTCLKKKMRLSISFQEKLLNVTEGRNFLSPSGWNWKTSSMMGFLLRGKGLIIQLVSVEDAGLIPDRALWVEDLALRRQWVAAPAQIGSLARELLYAALRCGCKRK